MSVPRTYAELITWSAGFGDRITLDPTSVGLTALQASDFQILQTALVDAVNTAANGSSNSSQNKQLRIAARNALLDNARELVRIVQAFPGTTNADRAALNITIPDNEPTPVDVPSTYPGMEVTSVAGRIVNVRLWDTDNATSRRKPAGVIGATIFSHIGATAPASTDDWDYAGMTGKLRYAITFPNDVPNGSTVWLTAVWFNSRKETGPTSPAISTILQGGSAQVA